MHRDATSLDKVCCHCTQRKLMACFAIKNKVTGARQSRCRECQKIASRAHYEANREEVIKNSAIRKSKQVIALKAEIAAQLAKASCPCGATEELTYHINPGYTGPRVSAALYAGLSRETVLDSVANSTVLCKACERRHMAAPLVYYTAQLRAGSRPLPTEITRAEYKARNTRTGKDLRTGRFERE